MELIATSLAGLYVVEPKPSEDPRGFFARTYCVEQFAERGIDFKTVQSNISFNNKIGTLRGLHYQVAPHPESKLVRCTMGKFFDVAVDIRKDSPTYLKWYGVELSAQNRKALYIPHGFAHGFQTLSDDSEVFYQMSEFYYPDLAQGFRWDDPKIGIEWPNSGERIMSKRDATYPLL